MTFFYDSSQEIRKIKSEISRDFILPPTKSEIEDINNLDADELVSLGFTYGPFKDKSRDEIFRFLNQQTEMFSNLYLLILNPLPRFDDGDFSDAKRRIEGEIIRNLSVIRDNEESVIKALKKIPFINHVIPIPFP